MTTIILSIFGISISVGLLVIVLVLLTPFLNKRYAAKWKYFIWIVIAFRLLIPFGAVNGQLTMDALSQTKSQTASELESQNTDTPPDTVIPTRRIIVEIPSQMTTPITVPSGKNKIGITILDIAALIWLSGSLIFLSVHFISYAHYKRQVMKIGKWIEDAPILTQMSKLRQELHIKRTIQAIEYHEAESPMIIGFLKPVFVLPKEQYSAEELYFIIKHELVHLKRGDVYWKLLFVTANAVHWFNPLIWIMQKEAVIDMELSCDERVIQGASYTVRKAYTETLLSTLHKRCAKRTVLSTQFYGGTKIMKKRFRNILIKNRKKNGIFLLLSAVVLTIGLGTLVGCSITKEDTEKEVAESEDIQSPSDQSEREEMQETAQTERMPANSDFANDNTLENTTVLTFSKEGEQEEKQASLVIGDGYSFYLPDDEWQQSEPDLWRTTVNEQVLLWITHFEGESMDSVDQKLEGDGYAKEDNHKWLKQEGDLIYHVEQKVFENDVWGIFYSYPTDCEEGWGRELPVIADTFAISVGEEKATNISSDTASKYLSVEDCKEIEAIVDAFATAYFDNNVDIMQRFLANTYEGEIDTYGGTGTISDLTLKGLSDTDEKKIENGGYVVSLEFRDSTYGDTCLYLTVIFVKQGYSWKIQFYGVEG